jgi:large subunit ribosomal protein L3
MCAIDVKKTSINKPQLARYQKQQIVAKKVIKEFRVDANELASITSCPVSFVVTDVLKGLFVDISATSIGKGFAGPMKRWGFAGLNASHGVSVSHRSHGSTGNRQDPGRVFKNKKMAGRMGNENITTQNLKIVAVYQEDGLIAVKGSIPGNNGGFVFLKNSEKKKSFNCNVLNGVDMSTVVKTSEDVKEDLAN